MRRRRAGRRNGAARAATRKTEYPRGRRRKKKCRAVDAYGLAARLAPRRGVPLQRRLDDLEGPNRRRRRSDRPSWSWADLRSTLDPTYRRIRFADPPSTSSRSMGSSVGPPTPASFPKTGVWLPWPSPLLQGFTRGHLPRGLLRTIRSARLSWGSSPFSTCQIRGSTCAGLPPPATFRPQGFDPLDGLLPANPPDRVSGRSAPGLPPFRGFLLQTRRRSFRSPSPPRRWPPAAGSDAGDQDRTVGCAIREPVHEASRAWNPYLRAGCYASAGTVSPPGLLPPWGSYVADRAAPIPRPSLPGLPGGLRACAPPPPRPSEVFDGHRPCPTPRAGRPLRGSFPLF
jgi:hypothetical protein